MKLMMLFLICLVFYQADAKSSLVERLVKLLESELSVRKHQDHVLQQGFVESELEDPFGKLMQSTGGFPCSGTLVDNEGMKYENVNSVKIPRDVAGELPGADPQGDYFIFYVAPEDNHSKTNVHRGLMLLADNAGDYLASRHITLKNMKKGHKIIASKAKWDEKQQNRVDRFNWNVWQKGSSMAYRKHAGNRKVKFTLPDVDWCHPDE